MIETIDEINIEEVVPLIRKYLDFYEVSNIDDSKSLEYFSQFGSSSEKGCLFGYRFEGKMVAFATVYFSYASSILSKVGILNDLYTSEDYRRRGIGTELIIHCEKYARKNGAARLQWLTASNNKEAQELYNALGASHSTWEVYTYAI